ncbi:hypothetical protein K0M31_019513 [Melipona bicolor]|uniref:Uncharacterized protein n=1 Tax=Melipona bicolor TaxID=60889 RepID=A0AA40G2W8_9HYME|nr:hypothetical protein K0M31_019513 [Melipona bicolor]
MRKRKGGMKSQDFFFEIQDSEYVTFSGGRSPNALLPASQKLKWPETGITVVLKSQYAFKCSKFELAKS